MGNQEDPVFKVQLVNPELMAYEGARAPPDDQEYLDVMVFQVDQEYLVIEELTALEDSPV